MHVCMCAHARVCVYVCVRVLGSAGEGRVISLTHTHTPSLCSLLGLGLQKKKEGNSCPTSDTWPGCGSHFVSHNCAGLSLKPIGLVVDSEGPRGPTDQGLNSRLLPQTLVVPPQIKLHLPVTLSTGTFATSLQYGDCPQAERVPASLQPPRSPSPAASPPLGLGDAKNQNSKGLPLRLSHHVPLRCLWGR